MDKQKEKTSMKEMLQRQIQMLTEAKAKNESEKPCVKAVDRFNELEALKTEIAELQTDNDELLKLRMGVISVGICPSCADDLEGKQYVKAGGFNHEKPYNKLADKNMVSLTCKCGFVYEYEIPQQQAHQLRKI